MNRVLVSVPSVLLAIFCAACGSDTSKTPTGSGGSAASTGVGGSSACTAPLAQCPTGCVDPKTDSLNCGTCGTACPAGRSCQQGVCACTAPLQLCGTTCVDIGSDSNNCGACANVCTTGQVCSQNACSSSGCAQGLTQCGSSCIDTKTSPLNCGECNTACGAGQTCTAGVCTGGTATGGAGGTGGGGTTPTGGTGAATTGGAGGTTTGGEGGVTTGGEGGVTTGGEGGATTGGEGGSTGGVGTDGGSGGTATGGDQGTGGAADPNAVTVQLDKTYQTIQGFGLNVALMSGSLGSSVVNTLYGTSGADALGLSIMRIGLNSNGSLSGTPSDISAAKSAGAKIIGSCWSPPADCKTNSNTQQGGHLISDDGGQCYESWSTTIANFAKDQGLYAMSIANESDFASCKSHGPPCTDDYDTTVYTAKEMVAWVKVAGPKLKAAGVKVIAPEASEWIHAWSNASATGSEVSGHPESTDPLNCGCYSNTPTETGCAATCLEGNGYDYGHWLWDDQEAWQAFDIFGVHEYDSQIAYAWPADVNDGKRDKEVWQTEMSGVKYWPQQGPSTHIDNGVAVAGWIHSALTVGEASAWLYWWYQAYYQDDNEGLLLKGSTAKTKRYYTLGNYSKFVRPGYIRVDVADASNDVLLSAYKSEDGKTVAIVAINKGSAAASPKIGFAGGTAPTSCTPTVTSADEDLEDGTAVNVADGVLTASLASNTVTTYVCE